MNGQRWPQRLLLEHHSTAPGTPRRLSGRRWPSPSSRGVEPLEAPLPTARLARAALLRTSAYARAPAATRTCRRPCRGAGTALRVVWACLINSLALVVYGVLASDAGAGREPGIARPSGKPSKRPPSRRPTSSAAVTCRWRAPRPDAATRRSPGHSRWSRPAPRRARPARARCSYAGPAVRPPRESAAIAPSSTPRRRCQLEVGRRPAADGPYERHAAGGWALILGQVASVSLARRSPGRPRRARSAARVRPAGERAVQRKGGRARGRSFRRAPSASSHAAARVLGEVNHGRHARSRRRAVPRCARRRHARGSASRRPFEHCIVASFARGREREDGPFGWDAVGVHVENAAPPAAKAAPIASTTAASRPSAHVGDREEAIVHARHDPPGHRGLLPPRGSVARADTSSVIGPRRSADAGARHLTRRAPCRGSLLVLEAFPVTSPVRSSRHLLGELTPAPREHARLHNRLTRWTIGLTSRPSADRVTLAGLGRQPRSRER